MADLDDASKRGGLVLAATGSFLGEGFDCPPLDTVFMVFPIAFRGRVVQYVGRILRPLDGKSSVEVHDYVDAKSPVLARMYRKRLPGYAALGFDVGKDRKNRSAVK
jgi:superfamily II DNA or RNA helicase